MNIKESQLLEKLSPKINGKKFNFPKPSKRPTQRLFERLTHFNQLHVYIRICDATGKRMLSMFNETVKFPVYDNEYWWGDNWDPCSYGRNFNFNRSFFEQIEELRDVVPQLARSVTKNVNSDYCNNANQNKNGYLIFNTGFSEDCMYSENVCYCKDCIDCSQCKTCELCYECILCTGSYRLRYSENCESCDNSAFLLNCRSCSNCFGCTNLHRKEYCIFNKQYSKSDYELFMQGLDLMSHEQIESLKKVLKQKVTKHPRPHILAKRVDEVTGNVIFNSKDTDNSYFVFGGESLLHCFNLDGVNKDCMDYSGFGHGAELVYQSVRSGINIFNCSFCIYCNDACSNLQYCISCRQSSNCFGCVGLRRKQYCIFNKQYSKEEYEKLVPRIIEHMRVTGEWGQFFSPKMSAIPYNHSLAMRYFPITKDQAIEKNYKWHEEKVDSDLDANKLQDGLPENSEPIKTTSVKSKRPFLITTREIDRYRELEVPLPRTTYDERIHRRASHFGGVELIDRNCDKTSISLKTVYGKEWKFPLWEKREYEREFFG